MCSALEELEQQGIQKEMQQGIWQIYEPARHSISVKRQQ